MNNLDYMMPLFVILVAGIVIFAGIGLGNVNEREYFLKCVEISSSTDCRLILEK